MPERAGDRRRRAAWLLPSLALHAALLSVGAWRHARSSAEAPVAARAPAELDVEMLEPLEPTPLPVAIQEPSGAGAPVAARPSGLRGAPASAARLAVEDSKPSSDAEPMESGEVEEGVAAAPSASGAPLSLAQLGLGSANPFLQPGAPATAPAQRATEKATERAARVKRRLDRALAQGLLSQDTAAGRGAGSPVLRSLEAVVYASTVPLNGQASFVFIIDGEGKLLSSTLGDASGDREAWSRVARQTAQSLAQRKLSVPKGKSVRLTVAVSSHLELPSGADPGVAVDVLGLPLKRGGGPRSTKVDLLNPRNPLAPLSLMGDPADIGQKARRMVHAHVVSEELL